MTLVIIVAPSVVDADEHHDHGMEGNSSCDRDPIDAAAGEEEEASAWEMI